LQDQGGNFVLVVGEGQQAQRRPVQLGRSIGAEVVIENGLDDGETIITEGVQRVRPGQPVNPAPATPRPAAPAAGRQG
jgi:membrane fusion protein (multidrug efflux system)